MSKKTGKTTPRGGKTSFQVKPVLATAIAAVVLEELSHQYGDCCNYLGAASLVRAGSPYLALTAIQQHNASRPVASARECWVQAQALAVVKKLVDPEVDRWPLTKAKWFQTEARCKRLNQKFVALANRRVRGEKESPYSAELYRFYEALVYVLGETPPVDDIAEAAHYGPGSTVEIRGAQVHYQRKLEAEECTPLAIDLAALALSHDKAVWAHIGMDPVYAQNPDAREGFLRVMRERLMVKATRHDRLMFIHKNIESLRSIGAQPTCSGALQLGIHSILSPLLAGAGIDLQDQSWNQKLAYLGSRDWESDDPFCTLDKSDASNLICKNLVTFHFPPAWSKLLMRVRTPGYEAPPKFGGGLYDYEMYAGMGNGTTFVVESLIFWAACYATSSMGSVQSFVDKKEFAVYGDDVVLRRSHAQRYQAFANFLGFRFNVKKTFLDGPFRESCGADYYAGTPVRPATLDSETGRLGTQDLIGFHNTLADNLDFPLPGACARIRKTFRSSIYPLVPTDGQGNLGFRPMGVPYYSLVKTKDGTVPVSPAWQRPRVYMLDVEVKRANLGRLDPWTEMAVALLKARQTQTETESQWSLPVRDAVFVKIVPERDLERVDLVTMLRNQLNRLAVRKAAPWWESHRGLVEGA